jgi:hypothetical protein
MSVADDVSYIYTIMSFTYDTHIYMYHLLTAYIHIHTYTYIQTHTEVAGVEAAEAVVVVVVVVVVATKQGKVPPFSASIPWMVLVPLAHNVVVSCTE